MLTTDEAKEKNGDEIDVVTTEEANEKNGDEIGVLDLLTTEEAKEKNDDELNVVENDEALLTTDEANIEKNEDTKKKKKKTTKKKKKRRRRKSGTRKRPRRRRGRKDDQANGDIDTDFSFEDIDNFSDMPMSNHFVDRKSVSSFESQSDLFLDNFDGLNCQRMN